MRLLIRVSVQLEPAIINPPKSYIFTNMKTIGIFKISHYNLDTYNAITHKVI